MDTLDTGRHFHHVLEFTTLLSQFEIVWAFLDKNKDPAMLKSYVFN